MIFMIMGYTIIVFFFLIFIILFHPIYYSVSTYRIQSHARINACKYQIQLWWYHKRSHRARDLSTNSRSWSTLCFRITLGKLCFYSCVLLLLFNVAYFCYWVSFFILTHFTYFTLYLLLFFLIKVECLHCLFYVNSYFESWWLSDTSLLTHFDS